jgi:hypothetical protein
VSAKGGKPAAARVLPPVTVARRPAAPAQIDTLVEQKADIFAIRGQRYREVWRDRSERSLEPDEVAQVAGALGAALGRSDITDLLAEVSESNLRTKSDPPRLEVLLAAGIATAPALIDACLDFVALIELPADAFEQASDAGTLFLALEEPVRALKRLELAEANQRARAAFSHIAAAAETTPGEAVGLILRALGTSLSTAIGPLSDSGSLIGSLARTGGAAASASTSSPGETPAT